MLGALYCPLISHVSRGACCLSFKVHYSIDNVSFLDLNKLNDFLWFACRLMNAVSQIPLYLFCLYLLSLHFIVA